MTESKYQIVKLNQIQADENQPRKHFDAAKLHMLKESIKKEGIISPMIVSRVGDNYLLLDGERRFRAAQELKLKEVPVLIEPAGNKIERLTRQFVVQEQHENWQPSEKANALINLSDEIGISLYETCKLLNVSDSDVNRYVAFSQLVDREAWMRSEIPVDYAVGVRSLRNTVARLYERTLKKEFTHSDEKKLEKRVIQSVKDGHVIRRGQLVKLKDAFVKNPKLVEQYLSSEKETPVSIYLKAEAQGATALRNMMVNATYLTAHGRKYLEHRDVKVSPEQVVILKTAKKQIEAVIDLAE